MLLGIWKTLAKVARLTLMMDNPGCLKMATRRQTRKGTPLSRCMPRSQLNLWTTIILTLVEAYILASLGRRNAIHHRTKIPSVH
jgi:hypothetical protein